MTLKGKKIDCKSTCHHGISENCRLQRLNLCSCLFSNLENDMCVTMLKHVKGYQILCVLTMNVWGFVIIEVLLYAEFSTILFYIQNCVCLTVMSVVFSGFFFWGGGHPQEISQNKRKISYFYHLKFPRLIKEFHIGKNVSFLVFKKV